MTEQQIENLKSILSCSEQTQHSDELDRKIIAASKANAPERKRLIDALSVNYQSLNLIGSIAFSILLTVGLFFSLSFILPNEEFMGDQSFADNQVDFEMLITTSEQQAATTISEVEVIQRPVTEHARDQILAAMNPQDIKGLLDDMEFADTDDRQFAEIAVTEAMDDIRFMVMQGQLNDARDRYDRLRRSCSICTLPETLEALVLNEPAPFSRS